MKRSGVRTATPASPAAASRTSWAVTTLLFLLLRLLYLGRSLLGLAGRARSVLVLGIALPVVSLVFLHHPGHIHQQIARGEVHHLDALRVAARDADPFDRNADHDAFLGDHHQLVVGEHLLERHDVAGLVRTLQGDDAPSAAVLHAVLVELGALAHPLLRDDEQRGLASHHDHVDHVVLLVELDPFHPGRRAPHVPHVLLVEPDAHAVTGGEHDVVAAVGDLDVDQLVALLDIDGPDPHRARIPELRQPRLLHNPLFGGEQEVLVLGEFAHRHQGREALVRLHGDGRDDRLAARGARRLRNLVDLEPVALPLLGEEHDVVVRRGDEQVLEPVVFLGMGGDDALAAAPLAAVRGHREPLDVARVGHGDDHVLFGDQVLDRELALVGDDLGAALVAEAVRQLLQGHLLGRPVYEREHDRAERHLHLRVHVQLIEDHHRHGVALELDHQPDAVLVGLVPQIRDSLELLRHREIADLIVHALRTDLVGEFRYDDLLPPRGFHFLGIGAGPDHDPTPALLVALLDAFAPVDDGAGGEVRAFDELPQVLDRRVRVVHQVNDRLDRLAEIVRRNVRRHPDRNTR